METRTPHIEWATTKFIANATGMTVMAIDELRRKGRLREHYHWKMINRRIWIHITRFNQRIAEG